MPNGQIPIFDETKPYSLVSDIPVFDESKPYQSALPDIEIDESPLLGVIPEQPPEHPTITSRDPMQRVAQNAGNLQRDIYNKKMAANKAEIERMISAGYPVNPEAAAFYGVELPEAPKPPKPVKEKVPTVRQAVSLAEKMEVPEFDEPPPAVAQPPVSEATISYQEELGKSLQELRNKKSEDNFVERFSTSFFATALLNVPSAGYSYYAKRIYDQAIANADIMTPEEKRASMEKVISAYAMALALEPQEAKSFTEHLANTAGMITGFIFPTPAALLTRIGTKLAAKLLPKVAARTLGQKLGFAAVKAGGAGAAYGAAELPTVAPTQTLGEIAKQKATQFLMTEASFVAFGTAMAGAAAILPKAFYRQYDWTPERFKKEFPDMVRKVAKNEGTDAEVRLVQDVNAHLSKEAAKAPYAKGEAGLDVQIGEPRTWLDYIPALRDILGRTSKITGEPIKPPVTPTRVEVPRIEETEAQRRIRESQEQPIARLDAEGRQIPIEVAEMPVKPPVEAPVAPEIPEAAPAPVEGVAPAVPPAKEAKTAMWTKGYDAGIKGEQFSPETMDVIGYEAGNKEAKLLVDEAVKDINVPPAKEPILPPPAPTIPVKKEIPTLAPAGVTVTQQIPEVRAGEVVKPSIISNNPKIQKAFDSVFSVLPTEIQKGTTIHQVRIVKFPPDYEGEGGRLEIDGKGNHWIYVEKGEPIEETIRHEILHSYVRNNPQLSDKGRGYFDEESAVKNLETQLLKPTTKEVQRAEEIRAKPEMPSGKEELVGGEEGRLRVRDITEDRVEARARVEPPPQGKVAEVAPIEQLKTKIKKGRGKVSFEKDPIKAFVEERGNIAPDRDPITGKVIGWEEYKAIPLRYRGKVKLDLMADDLKREGLASEDFDGEALRKHLATPAKLTKITEEQFISDQADRAKHITDVQVPKLNLGDKFKEDGELHTVIDVSDQSVTIKNKETRIFPVEKRGEINTVAVDKGTLKKAKPEVSGQLIPEADMPFNLERVPEKSPEVIAREQAQESRRVADATKAELERRAQELPGVTELPKPTAELAREVGEIKPYRVELTEKDLITKPLSEIQKSAKAMDIPVENRTRKDVVDDIKTKQDEVQKEKLIDEMPVPEEMKRKRGLRNKAGAFGFEKPMKLKTELADTEATKVERMFEKQDKDIADKFKLTLDKTVDRVNRALWRVDAPIITKLQKNNAKDVIIAKSLARGWGGEAQMAFEKAYNDVFDTVPHKFKPLFDKMIQAHRTIEVSNLMREQRGIQPELFMEGEIPEVIKSPAGLGAKSNRLWLEKWEKQLTPDELNALETARKKYYNVSQQMIDKLLESGMIDKDFHAQLMKNHKNYSPRKFLHHIDPDIEVVIRGKKTTVSDSGIEPLDEGSEKSLVNDTSYLMQEMINRTYSRVAKNNLNKELFKFVESDKENLLNLKVETSAEAEKPLPVGQTRITAMFEGKPKTMVGPEDIMQYWISHDPQIKPNAQMVLQWLTGVKVLKALATGYNPEFAVPNIIRDITYNWFRTQEWSPHLPIAWAQQLKDIITVLPDVVKRTGRAQQYLTGGGSMDFLTTQGRFGLGAGGYSSIRNEALRQMESAAAWLGNTSELLGRTVVMERALKNGKSLKEAIYIARNTLDFSTGGWLTKTLDPFIPYLNAGTVAMRGILESARAKPWRFVYQAAQLISLAAGLRTWNKLNEECYDSISDSMKVSNFIFTTPIYEKDKNGNKRYFYFAFPKEQQARILTVIGEEIATKQLGGKPSYERIRMAAGDFFAVGPESAVAPTVQAMLSYMANKDFWSNQEIWTGREVDPNIEYNANVPEAWIKTGQMTGLSPSRLRGAVRKVVPNNPFVFIMGGLQTPLKMADDDSVTQKLFYLMSRTPIIRRVVRVTSPVDLSATEEKDALSFDIPLKYRSGKPKPKMLVRDEIQEARREVNNIRQLNDFQQDVIIKEIRDKRKTYSDLISWMKKVTLTDIDEADRLWERMNKKYPQMILHRKRLKSTIK